MGTLMARLGGTLRELAATGWTRLLAARVGQDRGVGPRRRLDRELEEPVEEQVAREGLPTVEPEPELVEVGGKVVGLDRAVVRPEEPALEERGDAMDARKGDATTSATVGAFYSSPVAA